MSHEVQIIEALQADTFQFLNRYTQLAVLVDENTKSHCYPLVAPLLPAHALIEIPSGEEHKHLGTCQHIWEALTQAAFDRKGAMLNLGGGVIGDMGGFCAATYKRGIAFVQVPTTLLAQVDASIGGKLGIDFQGFKNHIGVFQDPAKVIVFPGFLKTLPRRELRSGYAEVIKHCLIRDRARWESIMQGGLAEQDWPALIAHSIAIKKAVVAEDPTEKGLRKILNFGHTIGHAVETYFLEKDPASRLLHGEAIAIGMMAEAYLSMQKGWISEDELLVMQGYLLAIFGKVSLTDDDIEACLPLAMQDKKNEGGTVQASLLEGVGHCGFNHHISLADMRNALKDYQQL